MAKKQQRQQFKHMKPGDARKQGKPMAPKHPPVKFGEMPKGPIGRAIDRMMGRKPT